MDVTDQQYLAAKEQFRLSMGRKEAKDAKERQLAQEAQRSKEVLLDSLSALVKTQMTTGNHRPQVYALYLREHPEPSKAFLGLVYDLVDSAFWGLSKDEGHLWFQGQPFDNLDDLQKSLEAVLGNPNVDVPQSYFSALVTLWAHYSTDSDLTEAQARTLTMIGTEGSLGDPVVPEGLTLTDQIAYESAIGLIGGLL